MSNRELEKLHTRESIAEPSGCGLQPRPKEIKPRLEATVASALIVGIGSAHGDDRVGWLVADQIREFADRNHFELRIAKSPADLLDWIQCDQQLVICDACHGLGQVGDLQKWLWPAPEIFKVTMSGTHNLSLPTVLDLAKNLGRLPNEVVIWAIEGAIGQSTAAMSPEVLQAVPKLVSRITNDLNAGRPLRGPDDEC